MWKRNQLLNLLNRMVKFETFVKKAPSFRVNHFAMSSNQFREVRDSIENHLNQSAKQSRPYTIIVEGNIGSGKTTFLEPFARNHQDKVEVLAEPVEMWRNCQGHNLLQLMYENPGRYSLAFQTYVQLTMVKLHNQPTDKPIRIMERSLLRHTNILANIFLLCWVYSGNLYNLPMNLNT